MLLRSSSLCQVNYRFAAAAIRQAFEDKVISMLDLWSMDDRTFWFDAIEKSTSERVRELATKGTRIPLACTYLAAADDRTVRGDVVLDEVVQDGDVTLSLKVRTIDPDVCQYSNDGSVTGVTPVSALDADFARCAPALPPHTRVTVADSSRTQTSGCLQSIQGRAEALSYSIPQHVDSSLLVVSRIPPFTRSSYAGRRGAATDEPIHNQPVHNDDDAGAAENMSACLVGDDKSVDMPPAVRAPGTANSAAAKEKTIQHDGGYSHLRRAHEADTALRFVSADRRLATSDGHVWYAQRVPWRTKLTARPAGQNPSQGTLLRASQFLAGALRSTLFRRPSLKLSAQRSCRSDSPGASRSSMSCRTTSARCQAWRRSRSGTPRALR